MQHLAANLVLLCVLFLFHDALAQQPSRPCGCDVSTATIAKYDRQLWLSKKDQDSAIQKHLPWGIPSGSSHADHERLLVQRDYVIGYDDNLRVPVWTAHRLTAAELKKRSRLECFRNDQRLPDSAAAFCIDYDEPIFDRGHLVPNSDMTMSQQSMINTYMFSNMTPQHCAFNRGIWQVLEGVVRDWIKTKGALYIITGSVFDVDEDGARDDDARSKRMRSRNNKERVAVPTHQYKILLHQRPDGTMDTLSLMLPNVPLKVAAADSEAYLAKHLVSIDAIEATTGLVFFPAAAQEAPDAVVATKKFKAASLWPVAGKWPSPLDSMCK